MRVDVKALALATGTAAAAAFTVCALAVAIAPSATTSFFGFITHMDLSTVTRPLTLTSYLGGLIAWWVLVASVFGLAASLYNRFTRASLPLRAEPAGSLRG